MKKLPLKDLKTPCATIEQINGSPVRLSLIAPDAQEVFVAGSFNNWNPGATPLVNINHGRWVKYLSLPPGRYEYQFVVDGRWIHDRARELVDNPFGGLNSVIEVAQPPYKLAPLSPVAKRINPKWSWHYRTLIQLHDRLLTDRANQINEAGQPTEPHSMHLADSATDELDHELAASELDAEDNQLYDVVQAIKRILDGTYGTCELTGKPISAARLRAIPWTPYSKEAKAKLDLGEFDEFTDENASPVAKKRNLLKCAA
jgi:RNA polymerase-binding transcription factor DksA